MSTIKDYSQESESSVQDGASGMGQHVRPLTLEEHRLAIAYFHSADDALLETMGVERAKLIPAEAWFAVMQKETAKPLAERVMFYVGWVHHGRLVGHSNVNHMTYGDRANIHLHLWNPDLRQQGLGTWFFKQSVNFFLRYFRLQTIICEPRAENPGPNKLLRSLGLTPTRTYKTVPGVICFEQMVTRYEITRPFPET